MQPADRLEVSLRPLNPGDAPAYRSFRIEALRRTPSAFTSSFDEESGKPLAWSVNRLAGPDLVLGAFDVAANLIGTAGLSVPEGRQARHKGTLFGMAVASSAGGRGIGRLLVQGVLESALAQSLLQVGLTVTADNTVAAGLYLSCGFEVWGHEPRAVVVNGNAITKVNMVNMLDGYRTGNGVRSRPMPIPDDGG